MYYKRLITDDIYHLSGNDRRLSRFENMFTLAEGISYNAYLILDEKTCLIDGIDNAVRDSYNSAVAEILGNRTLDYFIVQHVEPDHCASINDVLITYPDAQLVISSKGLDFLKQFYPDSTVQYDSRVIIVGEGDTLDLGGRTLTFIAAPNVHWPEVIVTYDPQSKALFSADAFGSFRALEGHIFADQVDYENKWLDEVRRYYTNIVGRQGLAVQKLLAKAKEHEIHYLCPIHGLAYRTPEDVAYIIDKYDTWSSYRPEVDGVVIVYSSMYGNNHDVADALAHILADKGVTEIRVHDVSESEISEVISDMFKYSHAVIFAMNYNTELFPKMDALLREVKMLNYQNRHVSYVAAKSWGGRGLVIAKEILESCKNITEVGEPVTVTSAMAQEQLVELEAFADAIRKSLP